MSHHHSKGSSRSQSPATVEFTRSDPSATDDSVIRSRVQSPSTAHQEQPPASRAHHVKSHSRDLGVSPLLPNNSSAAVNNAPPVTGRNLEDSPQKQLLASLVGAEYPGNVYSPNVSYALSSADEYGSPTQYRGQFEADYGSPGQGDENDGGSGTSARAAAAIAHLNSKVQKTKDLIQMEQTIMDENVEEYLKLSSNADKQQRQRIKAVFEKKNQKSAALIAQLQKKLEGYQKRIKNWEMHGSSTGQGSHRQPREVLRDMGQGLKNVGGNIRDGITGLGGSVMAAPREFAHLFIRGNRFGSADNISQLAGSRGSDGAAGEGTRGNTLPRAGDTAPRHHAKLTSEEGSECSSVTSESIAGYQNQGGSNNMSEAAYSLKPILNELSQRREDYERLCEKIDSFKNLSQEVSYLSSALQEERFRSERLEEQINDLTELHQNEVENLKQTLADVEEKVQYQSEERLRDIHEALDLCQTKMSKLEHVCAQQGAALAATGGGACWGGDAPSPRLLLVKLLNVALTLLQLLLLLVATAAGIAMPFLRTRVRILTTVLVSILAIVVLKQWPEVTELSTHMLARIKRSLHDNR